MTDANPLHVLIVDDSEDHLVLLSEFVNRASVPTAEPVTRIDGRSGLETLKEGNYDCLFLDFDLPDINGIEVLQQAKEWFPGLAVVMVTAMGDEEIAVSAMKGGAMDYLVKGHVTVQTIERVLMNASQRLLLQKTVSQQQEKLIHAERQRVMLESIGAACHHFSQPVTSLLGRLELLLARNPPLEKKDKELLDECVKSTRKMQDILKQFQKVKDYRTVPYVDDTKILDIVEDRDPDRSSQ
jgi:DNA-binding response OmpR family regulator